MNGESKTKDILSSEQASFIKNKIPISVVNQPQLDVSICSDPISKIKPDQCAMVSDSSRQKKSLFQITRIVNNSVGLDRKLTEIVESMSDPSLPVLINGSVSAESINSGVKSIDVVDGNYLSSMERKTSQQLIGSHELSDSSRLSHHSNVQPSRFKVVRIASHRKPIIKGRWSCQDFVFDKPIQGQYISGPAAKSPKMTFHQAGGSGDDKPTSNDSGSEGSSLVNSIYYVQSGDEDIPYLYNACGMVYANGHLTLNDIQRDAHSSGYSSATVVPNSGLLVEHTFTINDVYNLMGPDCGTDHLDPLSNEMAGIPELSDADSCGAANSMCALDNKIEQAMDLVKSHLMFAVHEEVEQLKEQIKDLMIRRSVLEQENSILRASATPETLARLKAVLASKGPSTPETDHQPIPPPDCNDSLNDGIEQPQPSS